MPMDTPHNTPTHHPSLSTGIRLTDTQFALIRDRIAEHSGIYLPRGSERTLAATVAARLDHTGQSLPSYIAQLALPTGASELHHLAEHVANHETLFLRNQSHMEAVRDHIVPDLHRRLPPDAPLRIWSAGCSTGEEAYSLAMMVYEALGDPLPRPVELYGSDLSQYAIERARAATYRGRTLTNLPAPLLHRYFQRQPDGTYHVRPLLTNAVQFHTVNLCQPFPTWAHDMHIVFCQNVTIYFQLETFRALADRLYHALTPGGMLFLGFAETLWHVYDRLRLREVGGAFVYVREPASIAAPPPPVVPPPLHSPARPRTVRAAALPSPTTPPPPRATAAPDHGYHQPLAEAHARLTNGDIDGALALLHAIPLNGEHAAPVLTLIAQAHANRGNETLAEAEVRRALDLNPLYCDGYLLLGLLAARQHRYDDATTHLERARYLSPDAPLVAYHLAHIYQQRGRSNAARSEYQHALSLLAPYAPDAVLEGVAVSWLRASCEQQCILLAPGGTA